MPVLTFNKKDLLKLIGKELSDETLASIIEQLKPEVEKITIDEIELEITPDRPDFYGVEGIAKAIRDFIGLPSKHYKISSKPIEVRVEKVKIRPFVACALATNVKLDNDLVKYLMNLQEVLATTIGRKRKKVAIGLHDYGKIKGQIVYREALPQEEFVPLGYETKMSLKQILEKTEKGKEFYSILAKAKKYPVFSDEKGIFSFPPILNSERTRITKKTTSIFIDVTGINRKAVMEAINLLAFFFLEREWEIAPAKMKHKKKSFLTPSFKERVVEIEIEKINKLLGTNFSPKQVNDYLKRVGLKSFSANNKIGVIIPFYRLDVLHPVDIVEEVAIAHGYNNFEPELPKSITMGKEHEIQLFAQKLRQLMIGFGFQEVLTTVLTNKQKQYKKMRVKEENCVELENPVSKEYTCMRTWLLPNLLEFLSKNKRYPYPQKIFEIGYVVLPDKNQEVLAKNVLKLSFAIASSNATFHKAKSMVISLLKNVGYFANFDKIAHSSFINGRSASIWVNGKEIGLIGEVHPEVLENFEIEMPVVACELNLQQLKEF